MSIRSLKFLILIFCTTTFAGCTVLPKGPPLPSSTPRGVPKLDEKKAPEEPAEEPEQEALEMPSEMAPPVKKAAEVKKEPPLPSQKTKEEETILYEGLYNKDADTALTTYINEYAPMLTKSLKDIENDEKSGFRGINPKITSAQKQLKKLGDLSPYDAVSLDIKVIGKRDRALELHQMILDLSDEETIPFGGRRSIQKMRKKASGELKDILSRFQLEK